MLKPCASQLSRKQRLAMSELSKKPRPPAPAPSWRLKLLILQPSWMLRPGSPLRLSHSTGNMPKPSETWRNKSSERKAEAKLTSSPPVRLPYMPAQWSSKAASYHISLGQTPTSHPFTLSQGASPVEQPSTPAAPVPAPKQLPWPKRQHPSPDPVDSLPLAKPHPRQPQKGPPAPKSERSHLGTRYSSRATQKHSARTLTW